VASQWRSWRHRWRGGWLAWLAAATNGISRGVAYGGAWYRKCGINGSYQRRNGMAIAYGGSNGMKA